MFYNFTPAVCIDNGWMFLLTHNEEFLIVYVVKNYLLDFILFSQGFPSFAFLCTLLFAAPVYNYNVIGNGTIRNR